MNLPKTLAELHHSYVASCSVEALQGSLAERGVPRAGSPDVYIYECQQFGIEDARSLAARATLRPVSLSRRVFIVAAAVINTEAQNALLKTIEDPRGGAVFFFLIAQPDRLLPTFRSRTQLLDGHRTSASELRIGIQEFLKAFPAQRITMLEPFIKKLKDGEERDLRAMHRLLDELERALASRPESLRAVYRAKRYIADRGALTKVLLEQLALLV